jgi:hypothetical protein
MREILFRGKRIDNGEWVEGHNFLETQNDNRVYISQTGSPMPMLTDDSSLVIMMHPSVEVSSKTVGQFTGLTDKNGKKIFEGDLFYADEMTAVVIFKDGSFRLEWHGITGTLTEAGYDECGGGYGIVECEPIDWVYIHDMEVIGNIYDSPKWEV